MTLPRRSAPCQTIVADDTFLGGGQVVCPPRLCHGDGESGAAAMTPPALAVVRRGSKRARFWAHPNLEEQVSRLGRALLLERVGGGQMPCEESLPRRCRRRRTTRDHLGPGPLFPANQAARCTRVAGTFHHLPQIVPIVLGKRSAFGIVFFTFA